MKECPNFSIQQWSRRKKIHTLMGSKCDFKTVQNIMTNTLVSFTFAIERFFVFVCFTVIKALIEPLTQFTLFLPFVTLISTFIYLKWMTATFRLRQIVFHFSSDRISKDMPFNTYWVRVFELSSLFLSFCRRHAIQYEANRMDFFFYWVACCTWERRLNLASLNLAGDSGSNFSDCQISSDTSFEVYL